MDFCFIIYKDVCPKYLLFCCKDRDSCRIKQINWTLFVKSPSSFFEEDGLSFLLALQVGLEELALGGRREVPVVNDCGCPMWIEAPDCERDATSIEE